MENLTRPIVCDMLSDVQRLDVYGRDKELFQWYKKEPAPAHQFR